MKKQILMMCIMILCLMFAGTAMASFYNSAGVDSQGTTYDGYYTYTPANYNLHNLEHGSYYMWFEDWDISDDVNIVGAELFFDDIRDWTNETNDLFVTLLDLDSELKYKRQNHTLEGFGEQKEYWERTDRESGQINRLRNNGIELHDYHNMSSTASDITYAFESNELSSLISYGESHGMFGLGFDPDCHFYNNGISMKIFVSNEDTPSNPVPEPATMVLLGIGLIGLSCVGRKKLLLK